MQPQVSTWSMDHFIFKLLFNLTTVMMLWFAKLFLYREEIHAFCRN
jgi:hypothetical protein